MYVVYRFGRRFKEIAVVSKTGITIIMDGLGWTHVMKEEGEGKTEAEPEEGTDRETKGTGTEEESGD